MVGSDGTRGDVPLAHKPHGAEVEPDGLPNGKGLVGEHPPLGHRHRARAAGHLALHGGVIDLGEDAAHGHGG